MRGVLLAMLVAASAGCLRTTEFKCQTSADCSSGGAVCETTGYCSFTDGDCAGGRRYGDYSGAYSGKCIGDSTLPDGGGMGDGKKVDGSMGSCPSSYAALPNAGSHVYRVITGSTIWTAQQAACAADSGGYLAIPDDATELTALTTATAATRTWVGINDMATEGTYVTVKNTTPPFLTWASGEPNNQGEQDCVAAQMASPVLETDRCSDVYPAVCECEP